MIAFWRGPDLAADQRLTGCIRCRRSWFGRFVLQVEEEFSLEAMEWTGVCFVRWTRTRWRDARPEDFEFMRWSREIGIADR